MTRTRSQWRLRYGSPMRLLRSFLVALLFSDSLALAQGAEREFRGAWVATVNNIDWPSSRLLTMTQQKQELLAILDRCQLLRLNVVILQVRPACDALYPSKLEPWSEYLTGGPGKPPVPAVWDPLEFAVEQAHARGMELHAWVNPFRARHSTGTKTLVASNHVSKKHPEWVRSYGSQLWLDPGLAEVHDYSARVILDIVQRYDVDGLHIDDYFYPYPEPQTGTPKIPFPDGPSWAAYQKSGGKLARDDWRRDNVNRFIARMYREVHEVKPWVKVGISPFGIYRPGQPALIKGLDQFQSLYADPKTWLANGWLDYLAPQLYWRIDPPAQSFPALLKWWAENNPKHRLIVAGLNTYAVGTGTNPWPASEIARQVEIARGQSGVSGHIHWNMSALMKNRSGVVDELKRAEYPQPALPPAMRGGAAKPPAPKLTARATGKGAEFRCEMEGGAEARFFLVQERRDDGTWRTRIAAGHSFTQEQSPAPAVLAVRAVDKFGVAGEATVLAR